VIGVKPCNKTVTSGGIAMTSGTGGVTSHTTTNAKPNAKPRFQTTSQSYGKDTTQFLPNTDSRFYHPKCTTEITKSFQKVQVKVALK
jgi:hypothetical protein